MSYSIEELRHIQVVVADLMHHPGEWTVAGQAVSMSQGRAYERRGCQVLYRNEGLPPGVADVLVRWPVAAAHRPGA